MFLSNAFALLLSASNPTFANAPASVDYMITLNNHSSARTCVAAICRVAKKQGTGKCEYFSDIRVLAVNLTSEGVHQVRTTFCASSIEVDLEMNASPRVGRSNN